MPKPAIPIRVDDAGARRPAANLNLTASEVSPQAFEVLRWIVQKRR
ncbi:hypothetical protein [Alsobacter sp. R-9]